MPTAVVALSVVAFAAGCGAAPTLVETVYTHHVILKGTVVTTGGKPAAAVNLHVSYPAGVTGSGGVAVTDTAGMYSILVKRSDTPSATTVSAPLYVVMLTSGPTYSPPFIRDSTSVAASFGNIGADPPVQVVNLTIPLP